MNTILVWVLILHSWDGGMIMKDNIADYDSCDRMLKRAMASGNERRNQGGTVNGSCTQIRVLVPAAPAVQAPVINVLPAPAPAPIIKNNVIIKKAAQ